MITNFTIFESLKLNRPETVKTFKDINRYQDTHAENLVHSSRWHGSGQIRYRIENAGDILREFSKFKDGWADDTYLKEKMFKIKILLDAHRNYVHPDDSYETFYRENEEIIKDIRQAYELQPTLSEAQELARLMTLSVIDGKFGLTRIYLNELEKRFKELKEDNKRTAASLTETNQFDYTEEYAADPNDEEYKLHKKFWKIGDIIVISYSYDYRGIYELKQLHHPTTNNCIFEGFLIEPKEKFGEKDISDQYPYSTMCEKFIGRQAGNIDYPTDEEQELFKRFQRQEQFDL